MFTYGTKGLKKWTPHYMEINKNHARVLFDSLNDAFLSTDYNAKNLCSLKSPTSEKSGHYVKNYHFFKNANFL